jgi:DNA-binding CsgD family transcriptional regulator
MTRQRRSGRLDALTDREREMLALIVEGHVQLSDRRQLGTRRQTIEQHVGHSILQCSRNIMR